MPAAEEWMKLVPDIMVTTSPYAPPERQRRIAIELESDLKWDFGASLRQIKDYARFLPMRQIRAYEILVIIPKEYERFVPLYNNEGIPVWLWKATAEWTFERCGYISSIEIERPKILRKCENKKCNYSDHHLNKLYNITFQSAREKSLMISI